MTAPSPKHHEMECSWTVLTWRAKNNSTADIPFTATLPPHHQPEPLSRCRTNRTQPQSAFRISIPAPPRWAQTASRLSAVNARQTRRSTTPRTRLRHWHARPREWTLIESRRVWTVPVAIRRTYVAPSAVRELLAAASTVFIPCISRHSHDRMPNPVLQTRPSPSLRLHFRQ